VLRVWRPQPKTLVLSVVRRPRACSRRRCRCGLARRPPCRSTCTAAHRRGRGGGLQGARAAALTRPIAPPAAAPSGKLRQGRAGGRRAHGRRARCRAERRRGKRAAAAALRGRRRGAGAVCAAAGARKECSKCLGGEGRRGVVSVHTKGFRTTSDACGTLAPQRRSWTARTARQAVLAEGCDGWAPHRRPASAKQTRRARGCAARTGASGMRPSLGANGTATGVKGS